LTKILTNKPYRHKVDVVNNTETTIDMFNKNSYDLISLDYIIEGNSNGMDLYNEIRKTNKIVPILFVSGNIEFLESIKDLKINDPNIEYLSKPFQNKSYINAINKCME
jgi:two-component system, cell cycle sensor histidine kinase and response regulator CckA